MLRGIYTLFIGVLLAAFVGVGISTFYPEPKAPEYPSSLKIPRPEGLSEQVFLTLKQDQERFDQQEKAYMAQMQAYNRNVSIIAITAAVLILVISLTIAKQILLIADGLLLGGVITLGYGIIRGFGAEEAVYRFIIVSAGLVVALVLGYLKIIKPTEEKPVTARMHVA